MTRMHTCFLAAVLLTIVVHVSAEDLLGRRSNSGFDRRDRKNYERHQGYYDRSDDDYSYQSGSRRNRYPSHGSQPSSSGYSSRSRWPSSYDDAYETDDMSHRGYGMNMLSKFPGSFPSELPYHSGPTCHSLIDPQYPLFSDICGAVPQARYALPNSFGHLERWQVAQVLSTILDPTALSMSPPTCMRSLRLLLCPLLFPPCPTRFEAPPMLPCQPFCRAIKNQCAAPALDLLPCDLLPPSSDLCPMNPTPYSSLMSSFGQPSPFNSGMPPSSLASLLAQSALSQLDVSPSTFPSMFPPSKPPPAFQGSPFSSSPISSSPFSSMLSGAGLTAPTSNPLLNLDSILSEALNPILVDFPPLGMMRDVRHGPQIFPMMRSATETA